MTAVTKEDLITIFEAIVTALKHDDEVPEPGSIESWVILLGTIATINLAEGRGATQKEVSNAAKRAGMDPRGAAGFYGADREGPHSSYLYRDPEEPYEGPARYITKKGLAWLAEHGWTLLES